MMAFAVTKHDDGGGSSRLAVTGELDHDTSESLLALISNAAGQDGVTEVVVDLHRTTFLAAAGVRTLLRAWQAVTGRSCAFRVVNAHGIVHRVITISGVAELLAVTSRSTPPDAPAPGRGGPGTSTSRRPARSTGGTARCG